MTIGSLLLQYGDTPLHTASRYGHAGVTRIFISAKCKVNEQNKNGDTALHISSALKRRKIAKLLVESKIGVAIKNKVKEISKCQFSTISVPLSVLLKHFTKLYCLYLGVIL